MRAVRPRIKIIAAWLAVFGTVLAGLVALPSPPAFATTPNQQDFNPGLIVSDAYFFNGSAMTASEVQTFLNEHVSGGRCTIGDAGRAPGTVVYYRDGTPDTIAATCLKDWRQSTPSVAANTQCSAYSGSANETAAQIIYKVGLACNISQRVLIVLLEKEQSLVTDNWPWMRQYNYATGSNCPDSTGCDPEYGGFFYQVYGAAQQLQRYGTGSYTWIPVGQYRNVLFSTNSSCGMSSVLIQNRATAALYYYTPYQPNQAALNNLYGSGDGCSAYGNRNFWRMSVDWFNYDGNPGMSGAKYQTASNVTISGGIAAGSLLTANEVEFRPRPMTLTYQWKRDGTAISGAQAQTYRTVAEDIGHRISVTATAARTGYETFSSTAQTSLITEASLPARLADTRPGRQTVDGINPRVGALPGGQVLRVPVLGRIGIPETGVDSVALNVTVTEPQGGGWLTVFPTDEPKPNASNVNYVPGQTIPNMVIAKVGADGSVSIYSPTTTHIVVDVATWYPTTDPFEPMTPARLADTRAGKSTADGQNVPAGRVQGGGVLTVPVTGRMGIPADASAVVLNVTVTEPQGGGWLTVFPTGDPMPNASNLNYSLGETIPNLVMAKVGSDGTVSIFTPTTAHIIVDVSGWFPASGGFTALTPARLTDTRPGKSTADGINARSSALPGGQTMKVQIRGRVGIPAEATAVALNVTVTEPQGGGWITVFPSGQGMPLASNLNYVPGQTIPNMVISKIGSDGTVSIYSPTTAHIIVDVAGWFPAS
jgi:hypothetical protein